jgi:hypothetical protein
VLALPTVSRPIDKNSGMNTAANNRSSSNAGYPSKHGRAGQNALNQQSNKVPARFQDAARA